MLLNYCSINNNYFLYSHKTSDRFTTREPPRMAKTRKIYYYNVLKHDRSRGILSDSSVLFKKFAIVWTTGIFCRVLSTHETFEFVRYERIIFIIIIIIRLEN